MVYSSATLATSIASAAAVGVAIGAYFATKGADSAPAPLRGLACWFCGGKRRPHLPKRLILVRHGQSEGNIDPLLYTTVPDNAMHLTALGFEQAVAAGHSIKKMIGDETTRFIVSPYIRTIETFQGILKAFGAKCEEVQWSEEPRIREQDFGNFQEPLKIRECKAQRRRFGSFFYRFPSGESPADVYDRISSFLESLYRMFEKSTEDNYILVTHGVAIRVILTRYFKYRICEFEQLDNFHNGEFVVLELDEEHGRFKLGKVVNNAVLMDDEGVVQSVVTKEYPALRVHSMEALQSTLAPYPTSPVNHFRRASSAAMFPPMVPEPTEVAVPNALARKVAMGNGEQSIPEDEEVHDTTSSYAV